MGEVAPDEAPTVLLADADVLIDYREADLRVLKEVGTHVARLAVLSETLDEVRGVDRKIRAALGIEVRSWLGRANVGAEDRPPVTATVDGQEERPLMKATRRCRT